MSSDWGHEQHWLGGRRPSMRPPARIESRAALVAVAALVGFLVALQALEVGEERVSRLAAERPEDLTRILADLNAEADALQRQVSQLQVRLLRYRGSARGEDVALRDARRDLADLQVLAGTVPVRGPGVVITLEGSEIEWDALLDLVQELRDAGAEAIAVNDRRVLATTWFGPDGDGLVMDGRPLAPPYRLAAIGAERDILEALDIPGGPLTVLSAQPGISVRTRVAERLVLPAAERVRPFVHARPAG